MPEVRLLGQFEVQLDGNSFTPCAPCGKRTSYWNRQTRKVARIIREEIDSAFGDHNRV